jgi:NADH-quinone oxidoreductase subunit J
MLSGLEAAFFYLFAFVAVASAFMVISARNPVHSVLFLILTFFNAAGLFMLTGAEFLAMILLVVYVGAVMVLFLFVVMMLDVDFAALRSGFTRNLPFGILLALVLLAEMIIAVAAWKAGPVTAGVGPAATNPQPNIVALGELLYTRFLMPFEIAGLILLVAMIGAIVLTHRSRGDVRGQNIRRQIDRRPQDAVKNMQPSVGEGMTL